MSVHPASRRPVAPWLRAAGGMFAVGWGANQFASMLVAYRADAGVSVPVSQALFGFYALGLIPALLVGGPASDRFGRRTMARAAALTSLLATVTLMAASHTVAALYAGRLLAGLASGMVFAPGTAWVKELSGPPHDLGAGEQAGARRAAIGLSMGFGLGPLVAGLVAQWAPDPLVVAYLPHLLVLGAAGALMWTAPETVTAGGRVPVLAGLRVRAVGHPRFRSVVAPAAPWVFLAPSVATAVIPGLVARHTHGLEVAFAAVLSGLTLAVGVLVQPLARRLDRVDDARGLAAGLICMTLGALVGAWAARTAGVWPALLCSVLMGAGFGLTLVSGLLEVQRLVAPAQLAGLTAVYYAATYVGFAAPLVLAELHRVASYPVLLVCTAALAVLTAAWITVRSPRLPASASRPVVLHGLGREAEGV